MLAPGPHNRTEIAEKCITKQVLLLPDEPKVELINDLEIGNAFAPSSEGLKVAVQAASMCVDTGLVEPGATVISVGGTNTGADTAIVLMAYDHKHVSDCKIEEIIAIPEG